MDLDDDLEDLLISCLARAAAADTCPLTEAGAWALAVWWAAQPREAAPEIRL